VKETPPGGSEPPPPYLTTLKSHSPEYLFACPCILLCAFFHKACELGPDSPIFSPVQTARHLLAELYAVATAAVAPGPAVAQRLAGLAPGQVKPIWIVALGKAALPMAQAAVETLRERGGQPLGGLVVAPAPGAPPSPSLEVVVGDHPEPGPGSFVAAEALARVVERVRAGHEVWVLLSGGTTSLIGAPVPGIAPAELSALYQLLLGSGLDIAAMNRIRKRFSRWGAGRLAQALAPARVRVLVVSDVIGDDLASIGSGPCVPDASTAVEVRQLLEGAGLWQRIPAAARRHLAQVEAGTMAETPKPGDQAFADVTLELVASNRLALEAAAKRAAELGLAPVVAEAPLAGEAATAGASVAATLLHNCGRQSIPQPVPEAGALRQAEEFRGGCWIWGGETTVTLGPSAGLGGRCQELALAAARDLSGRTVVSALLAAGTDGRDGPTDAAGAIVDGSTWPAIVAAGRDPGRDLESHNAYRALDAVGALLRPGLTGTNVMDVVIGVCLEGGEK
jgi:glycerate 2-kinase